MKNIKYLVVFSLLTLISSCSKDETIVKDDNYSEVTPLVTQLTLFDTNYTIELSLNPGNKASTIYLSGDGGLQEQLNVEDGKAYFTLGEYSDWAIGNSYKFKATTIVNGDKAADRFSIDVVSPSQLVSQGDFIEYSADNDTVMVLASAMTIQNKIESLIISTELIRNGEIEDVKILRKLKIDNQAYKELLFLSISDYQYGDIINVKTLWKGAGYTSKDSLQFSVEGKSFSTQVDSLLNEKHDSFSLIEKQKGDSKVAGELKYIYDYPLSGFMSNDISFYKLGEKDIVFDLSQAIKFIDGKTPVSRVDQAIEGDKYIISFKYHELNEDKKEIEVEMYGILTVKKVNCTVTGDELDELLIHVDMIDK